MVFKLTDNTSLRFNIAHATGVGSGTDPFVSDYWWVLCKGSEVFNQGPLRFETSPLPATFGCYAAFRLADGMSLRFDVAYATAAFSGTDHEIDKHSWVHYRGDLDTPREIINQGPLRTILRKGTRE